MTAAATIATVLLLMVSLFQLALALGAPLGAAAWGGRHRGVLPAGFRVASAIAAIFVYPFVIVFVLASAETVDVDWLSETGQTAMWILTGFFSIGAVANFASRSKAERVWGPVSLGIAICCGVIAASV